MASLEVLHTQTQSDSGSFPSDEYSLLPEVETGTITNGDINHHDDCFNFTNMTSALSASSTDSVEVHSQLDELIEENLRLKEQLNKNNSMMEDQISTIQSWRDHMLLSKTQLRDNLKIATEKISFLEKENSELQEKMNMIKVSEKEEGKPSVQCTENETELNNVLAVDFEKGNNYVMHEWNFFRENLHENLKFVCKNLETVSGTTESPDEKLLLDCYISMLKFKIASLKGDIGQLISLQTYEETDYEIVRLKTHEEGTQKFHKVIEELKQNVRDKEEKITCLMNERELLTKKVKEYETKMQEWDVNMKSQYELLNSKLQNESCLSQKYRERCESLQQQIEDYQTKLEQSRTKKFDDDDILRLKEEVQQLQGILKLEHESKEVDKKKYSILMEKCETLQVDYDRVTKLLEIQSKEDKEKNDKLSSMESDVKKYMEEVDHLTAKLFVVEEKLEESDAEVKRLQAHITQIDDDTESVPILKAQIEVYKTDYNNLESDKKAVSDEVERLKNELKRYEKDETFSSAGNRRSSAEMPGENGATSKFNCPVCSLGFTTESAAEKHINRCLDQNNS